MSVNNWSEIGSQIREAVETSLNTGDFQQLGDVISGTVDSAVSEVKYQFDQVRQMWNNGGQAVPPANQGNVPPQGRWGTQQQGPGNVPPYNQGNVPPQNRWGTQQQNQGGVPPQNQGYAPPTGQWSVPKRPRVARVRMNPVGKVSGILFMIFGGIGTGLMALALISLMITAVFGGGGVVLSTMIPVALLFAAFIFMVDRGCAKRERWKRAQRYVELCGNNRYINIDDLALHAGKNERFVLKDVKKMIQAGIFPEGHLDQEEACLMLDDATYRQYLAIQKERKAREMEEKVAKMQAERNASAQLAPPMEQAQVPAQERPAAQASGAAAQGEPENPELAAMIREGQDCIRKLRDMNDNIEGEVISAKLFQLENLLKEIFQRVREHPEQMPQMQKFMKYYLPTTLKLVEAYEEFDSVSVPGEDIIAAKGEIEKTLDTINNAFAELLNKLFRASVYDATTDAQVLQTMLAKEGLMKTPEFQKAP